MLPGSVRSWEDFAPSFEGRLMPKPRGDMLQPRQTEEGSRDEGAVGLLLTTKTLFV